MADRPTSFRLSDETRRQIARRAKELRISQADVVELAVREFADRPSISESIARLRTVTTALKKAGFHRPWPGGRK
jgi:predicted transcriptional regulator